LFSPNGNIPIAKQISPLPLLRSPHLKSIVLPGSVSARLSFAAAYGSFGGFSALLMDSDGEHFLALSDRAMWLRGRIVYQDGRPAGIADAVVAPVLDDQGKPAPRLDTESITRDGNTLYVGLERTHSILRFDYDNKGFPGKGRPIPVPAELKDLPNNQSLEALVFVPKKFLLRGTLIAFSEHGLTKEGNLKSFLIGGPKPGMFAVRRTDGYDISDAAMLPKAPPALQHQAGCLG
jgi:hypothetical protein